MKQESGLDRIKVLFELIEFAESCIAKQCYAKNPMASESDISAKISSWYASSQHFTDSTKWRLRKLNSA
jgi:hypothetical protein